MKLIINKFNFEDSKTWDDFVLNDSLNGTIYHTKLFLSYHKDKFNDRSILIYDKNKLISVFPCCKVNNEYYSHLGSTCGGIVILEKYYELTKLTEIMDKIYEYYDGNLHIKLSETVYFKNTTKNDLLNFVLSQKCKSEQDISLYFDIKKNINIIDSFPKNDNKRLLVKYINSTPKEMSFMISNNLEDYKKYYYYLEKFLEEKNGVKPLHSLDEFILLKEILGDKQFLFLSKDSDGEILSGALIFLINSNTYYTAYLMTNYDKKNSHIFYLLYELFELAKKNNIDIVNLGACSTNGGKEILYSKYTFKSSCGCSPIMKYSFSYIYNPVIKVKFNIFITAISSNLGYSIYKVLTKYRNYFNIYGGDISNYKSKLFNFENFELLPKASDHNYIEKLNYIINKYNIDLVIPAVEQEIKAIYNSKLNCEILILDKDTLDIGFNKYKTIELLKKNNIPCPKTEILNKNNICRGFPFIIKGAESYGSKDVFIIKEEIDLKIFKLKVNDKSYSDFIIQEYIDGEEYTCCVYKYNSDIKNIILKRKMANGYTSEGTVVDNHIIEKYILDITSKLNFNGSINYQLRLQTNQPYLFEINPRISSSVYFRHLLNFNDLLWFIQDKLNFKITELDNYKIQPNLNFCRMDQQFIV